MSCGKTVVDYVINLCYHIPCEYTEISIDYFERLNDIGILFL